MKSSKIDATIDQKKLEKSIKRYAKAFGESSAQAVTRWSVQTCRELAKYTQPFGKESAYVKPLWKDALNCLIPLEGNPPRGRSALRTPQQIMDWIDLNRIRKGRRVPKLPIGQKKKCSMSDLKKVISLKSKNLGMAKGGWIGAGNIIAQNQTGSDKFSIGVNYLKYAQKHANLGKAKPPQNGFKPTATVTNQANHSADNYVLRIGQIKRAISDGRKKCLKFYEMALKAINKKKS